MWQFVLARGVQGLGAARSSRSRWRRSPTCSRFQERGRYQGLFGAVFALSSLLGPAIGG
jgi:MFS family permease